MIIEVRRAPRDGRERRLRIVAVACCAALGTVALVSTTQPAVVNNLVLGNAVVQSPNLTAVRMNVLPLVKGAVAAASNKSGAVGDKLAWAANRVKGIAASRNWTAAEHERLDHLASQANDSYTDLLASTAQQVENVAWWLGGWVDPMPHEINLRDRLQALISLQSRLRGVAISLSWVSARDTFTLVAGEVDGREVRLRIFLTEEEGLRGAAWPKHAFFFSHWINNNYTPA